MLPRNDPDRIQITFDDHRLVANAGLILPTTLAHLGLSQLVDRHLYLGNAPRRANKGDKMMTLVASALAGGDCIDDADVLRTGGTTPDPGRHGQGAIHPGDVPAKLPVGPCPPVGPGEPRAAGPQPGTLDSAHRSGRTGGNHQDPATTLLLPRRTAHPLGAPPHFASSPALALGKPVQSRSGTITSLSTPSLTAAVCH